MSQGIEVEARGGLLIVRESKADFVAIYVKRQSSPQLTLMRALRPTSTFSWLKPGR